LLVGLAPGWLALLSAIAPVAAPASASGIPMQPHQQRNSESAPSAVDAIASGST
jgi:hypothetical protein